MTNQERLEKYLVGNNGYLKSDISNGKVIMLSGKWGSGKTFFWKNKIVESLKKEKISNNYISLYGKTSIQEIKNEVFLKIFESMDIFRIDEKSVNLAKNTANLIADFTKTVSVFGVNLDLSKIVDKSFEKLDEVREKQKEEKTKALLNSGAIICFDDFERKSKDIDLNDLFGFITNLTIEFDCKVVVILNDDVFDGVEKKIFSNVKEKSVSKFLKYEPTIEELFETLFEDTKYRLLDNYKGIIVKTIEDTEELNARIYIQVLDNLVEWIENNQEENDDVLRCLILVNINFILYHQIYSFDEPNSSFVLPILFKKFDNFPIKALNFFNTGFDNFRNTPTKCEVIELLKNSIKADYTKKTNDNTTKASESLPRELELIEKEGEKFWLYVYFEHNLNFRQNISSEQLIKINNFIESGILINNK